MFQFRVLSGKMAGAETLARHFPFRIGRAPDAELRLEGGGVWGDHLEIRLNADGFAELTSKAEALTLVNGVRVAQAVLHNGDLLELGEVRLQFWLSPVQQYGLAFREITTWLSLGAAVLVQAGLVWWLLRP